MTRDEAIAALKRIVCDENENDLYFVLGNESVELFEAVETLGTETGFTDKPKCPACGSSNLSVYCDGGLDAPDCYCRQCNCVIDIEARYRVKGVI